MPEKNHILSKESAKVEDETTLIRFQRSPDFRTIYANYVQTAHTAFDVSLTFGVTSGVTEEDGKVLVEQKARITLSPLEALVLQTMLNNLIGIFQQRFGKITIPDNFAGLKTSEGV
jgi:hypothetical protein